MRRIYSSFLQGSSDAVVIANTDTGIIEDVNPQGCELWGYQREELVGKSITTLHPQEELELLARRLKEMVSSPETSQTETKIVRKDGTIFPVSITSANTFQIEGKRYEARFFKDLCYKERLREIAFNEAHRIRGPLVTIMGCIYLLESDMSEEEKKETWGILKKSTKKMDEAIRETVDKTIWE